MNGKNIIKLFRLYKLNGIFIFLKTLFGFTKSIHVPNIQFPVYLRPNTSDIPVFHQIFTSTEYDVNFNQKVDLIIDAGANIGLSSVYFANKYPNAKILSIEPEEGNYNILLKNTSLYKNIIPIKKALYNKICTLNIVDTGKGEFGYMIESISDNTPIGKTTSITINKLIEEYDIKHIDILKLDIEGAERELFLTDYKNWLSRVRCLIIELHDDMKQGASKAFFTAISKFNFSFKLKGENLIFFIED